MMPDLGKYAAEVLTAYGASAVLIVALVWMSWARGAKVKRQLAEAEKEARNG
ncbi:heme exporter protein CcmD [Oceaniglobus ichthyenteri]|uniref:heme exporter protein CcmD n=1 Tax=Oceaniglobus ichthyenteri TaxID=2136177 RepID=UPI000D3420E9|nr:heme exporter protein CcmD [Oceaniglobus ichthyenteri]